MDRGAPGRLLRWEACLNARDVGGYPTANGRRTRSGALVRADSLCRLTPAGRAALVDYGVRTVVDLRFPEEVAREPNPFGAGAARVGDPVYLNIPVNAGRDRSDDPALSAAFAAARTREEANRLEVDANQAGFALIARAVARAPAGGVVVHCGSGKDRTGIAVALLLGLVGVPDEVIAQDYGLSATYLEELYERWLAERSPSDPDERARLEQQLSAAPETMLATLAHLRERHGGAEAYLLAGGLTAEEVARLRERLVELSA